MVEIELRLEEFNLFRKYIYDKVGIALSDQKSTLVKGRLNKRLNQLGLKSFRDYYEYLVSDLSGDELSLSLSVPFRPMSPLFFERVRSGNG